MEEHKQIDRAQAEETFFDMIRRYWHDKASGDDVRRATAALDGDQMYGASAMVNLIREELDKFYAAENAKRGRAMKPNWSGCAPNGYFGIDVFGVERPTFEAAMRLAFIHEIRADEVATHFRSSGTKFQFLWHEEKEATALPYKMRFPTAVEFAWGWLKSTPPAGHAPDVDGSVVKGFRIRGPSPDGWSYVFVEIDSIWAFYHK